MLEIKSRRGHVFFGAFRRSLENYNCIQLIIFLSDEKFASPTGLDRLLKKTHDEKEILHLTSGMTGFDIVCQLIRATRSIVSS